MARVGDADLAEHLADDDLDVFVVNGDALQAIDFLDFVDQMFLQFLRAADVEDFVRVNWAFGQLLAFLDVIALEDDDVFANGDEVLFLDLGLLIGDDDTALAEHAATEVNHAATLGTHGGVLGPTRFK